MSKLSFKQLMLLVLTVLAGYVFYRAFEADPRVWVATGQTVDWFALCALALYLADIGLITKSEEEN